MKLSCTGHRPPRLGLDYTPDSNKKLTTFCQKFIDTLDVELIITGGAQGFDQAMAHASYLNNIRYWVCVPFIGQESKWPIEAQKRYNLICDKAQDVIIVNSGGYSNDKFISRDRYMVDSSDEVVALYDGVKKGGTYETVKYAYSKNMKVNNIWNLWNEFVRTYK